MIRAVIYTLFAAAAAIGAYVGMVDGIACAMTGTPGRLYDCTHTKGVR